jgi:thiamine kinase-like enzyme
MLLTKHNLIHYLLDKNLLNTKDIITGEYSVRSSDSRNLNFIVNKEYTHHQYFVKQIKAKDQEKIDTLATEAACYALSQNRSNTTLNTIFPKLFHYDKLHHILITEQVKNVLNIHEYYFQTYDFSNSFVPKKLATILATIHSTHTLKAMEDSSASNKIVFKYATPWVFSITSKPLQYWLSQPVSAEQQAMILILKNQDFCDLINLASQLWTPNALIHNDIKFTNFIGSTNETLKINDIKLIDWELADYGDSSWDVACMIQNYIQLWSSTDIPDSELAKQPNVKRLALHDIQFCIRTFWLEYINASKMNPSLQAATLLKLSKFVAMKLIHTCFETTPYSPHLQPSSVKLLQIAHNILKSPENAIVDLFGIK